MRILAIETSCDESAVAILSVADGPNGPTFSIEGNALYSQVALHTQYGGVFPMLAKREHQHNLTPLLDTALKEAYLLRKQDVSIDVKTLEHILSRELELSEKLLPFL